MQVRSEKGSKRRALQWSTVRKEEVIAKLKDEGEFDDLRLKIIRKLKHNEELRNNIVLIVRQSAALNRPGAENMKPRQLSDEIYHEVGTAAMTHISDRLWDIIRSGDGMKNEIRATVERVYNQLVEPGQSTVVTSMLLQNDSAVTLDDELKQPPGFAFPGNHNNRNSHDHEDKRQQLMGCEASVGDQKKLPMLSNHIDICGPPGFSGEEDPDVPPGFG